MDYIIRDCRIDDIDDVVQLCARHAAYEGAPYFIEGKAQRLSTLLFAEKPALHTWVVEVSETVVGYCSYTFDFSTWDTALYLHVDCLYLDSDYRGKGIGEALLRRLYDLAKAQGCVNLQWQTPLDNIHAIRFYKRIGAVPKKKERFTWKVDAGL